MAADSEQLITVAAAPTTPPEQEGDAESDRVLTAEELYQGIQKIEDELRGKVPFDIVLPAGQVINGVDVSGKTLNEILSELRGKIRSPDGREVYYQPLPLEADAEAPTNREAASQTPEWLAEHPELVWEKPVDNPIWELDEKSYTTPSGETRVSTAYRRRGTVIRPGEAASPTEGAGQAVIQGDFSLAQIQVMRYVLTHYYETERALESDDAESRVAAKELYKKVLHEENLFRKGKLGEGELPETISQEVSKAIDSLKSRRRGAGTESVSVEEVTQYLADILSQLAVLNRTRGDGNEHIPTPKPGIKETPSFSLALKQFTEICATQLGHSEHRVSNTAKGFALLIGEAGTGKNEMVEYFAAKAKRPYFLMSCGRGMEAVDLVQHYEFDTKIGTQRFFTELARGIQTPGAVVLIDEANSLKPEVQAILHGLGDGNRTLRYDGITIPVAEGVVVILSGNPATYGSAGNFGEAVLSRAAGQSMVMEYPALRKSDLIKREQKLSDREAEELMTQDNTMGEFACDEVLALYPHTHLFKGLSDPEFTALWEFYINERTEAASMLQSSDNLKALTENPVIAESVKKWLIGLRDILKVADAWRKQYEARESGFDLLAPSMRDTIALTEAYNRLGDVRKAVIDTYSHFRKNPIADLDTTFSALELLIGKILQDIKEENVSPVAEAT